MLLTPSDFGSTTFARTEEGIIPHVNPLPVYYPKQIGGGNPSPAYTIDAMARDLSAPDRIVVVYSDRVEVYA